MPIKRRPPLPLSHPLTLIATWFGAGLLPKVPGTWGSLAALPFGAALAWWGGPLALAVAALAVLIAGAIATERMIALGGAEDPGYVVADEVGGQWLTLMPLPLDPVAYLVAFVLFRALDILKPWPVGWIDRKVKGGFGAMADDAVAGLIGAAILYLLLAWVPRLSWLT